MYQSAEDNIEDPVKFAEDFSPVHTNATVYSRKELLKAGLLLSCALIVSTLAIQQRSGFQTTSSVISRMTSLDQLPKDTIFAEVSDSDQQHLFNLYTQKFEKDYSTTDQYSAKLSVFKETLSTIDSKNMNEKQRGGSARHGITKYSDLSISELKSTILQAHPPATSQRQRGVAEIATIDKYEGSETAVDWSGTLTTAVVDQGYCGSCWAFSTAFQMESDAIRAGLLTAADTLSVEQLISCDRDDLGCSGGWTELGFAYASEQGLELASDYPYTSKYGTVGSCTADSSRAKVKVDNFYGISTEDELMDYVLSTGPVSVCVASSDWPTYVEGVMAVCGGEVDHCVQVVGVDKTNGYWKVRNTWGESWGEGGYIRLATGSNLCGIMTEPIYTDVSLVT